MCDLNPTDATLTHRGAKPRFGSTADVVVCLRVTPEQREKLQEVAARNLTTVADLLRDAVDSYVADFSDEPMFRPLDQRDPTQQDENGNQGDDRLRHRPERCGKRYLVNDEQHQPEHQPQHQDEDE
jgi:hypothetical protein